MTVKCVLCGGESTAYRICPPSLEKLGDFALEQTDCQSCGSFMADHVAASRLLSHEQSTRAALAGLAREATLRGNVLQIPGDGSAGAMSALLSMAPQDMAEKIDRFTINLSILQGSPGAYPTIVLGRDKVLAFAADEYEFAFIVRQVFHAGYVDLGIQDERLERGVRLRQELMTALHVPIQLTAQGWTKVAELSQTSDPSHAFIAMPFRDEFAKLHEDGLAEGIKEAGFTPIRIDGVHHADRIDDRIMAEIKKARFVVVDTTDSNANVLFEAGYALGLGKPVIWTCQKGHTDKLKFDFRQYNHITWEPGRENELAERLRDAIENIIGTGPNRPSEKVQLIN